MSWLFGGTSSNSTLDSTTPTSHISPGSGSDDSSISSILKAPGAFDSAALHPLAGLEKGIEYLDLEEEQLNTVQGSKGLIPSRSWSDDLCYGTGAVYLLGLGFGGLSGFLQGIKSIPPNASFKLQTNTVLNSITKRGPFLGNSAGVLALTYNLIDSSLDSIRGVHDDLNSVAAGAIAGAIFKSSAGIKQMSYSTILMAGAAGAWCGIKRAYRNNNDIDTNNINE